MKGKELEKKLDETKKLYTVDRPEIDSEAVNKGFFFQRKWHRERTEAYAIELPGGKAADVACGSGGITFNLLEKRPEIDFTGIDFNEQAIDFAKKKAGQEKKKISFVSAAAEKMPFPEGNFDSVLISDGLDHFVEPLLALKEARRIMKKNGKIVLTVCNYRSLFPLVEFIWGISTNFTNQRKWQHQRITRFNPLSLKKILEEAGFGEIRINTLHNTKPFFYFLGFFGIPFIEGFASRNSMGMTLLATAKK